MVIVQGSDFKGEFGAVLASANRMKTLESKGSNIAFAIGAVGRRRQMGWMNRGCFKGVMQGWSADSVCLDQMADPSGVYIYFVPFHPPLLFSQQISFSHIIKDHGIPNFFRGSHSNLVAGKWAPFFGRGACLGTVSQLGKLKFLLPGGLRVYLAQRRRGSRTFVRF